MDLCPLGLKFEKYMSPRSPFQINFDSEIKNRIFTSVRIIDRTNNETIRITRKKEERRRKKKKERKRGEKRKEEKEKEKEREKEIEKKKK